MKIRYFSDLHLERDAKRVSRPHLVTAQLWRPPVHADDAETTLVLAGDLWNGIYPLMFSHHSWMSELAARFRHVVVVLGNHDYWTDHLTRLPLKWQQGIKDQGLSNVHFLDTIIPGAAKVVLDGVAFVGGTLWTNMDKGNPLVLLEFDGAVGSDGRPLWNDRNYIRAGTQFSRFNAHDWLRSHRQAVHQLRQVLETTPEPTIWVSHHAPCLKSVEHRKGWDWALYGSDLSNLILDHPQIQAVIHGHVHMAQDYLMGDTRVLCNPRGYADSETVKGYSDQAAYFVR